ncbi:MAG: hypothetical protein ACLPTZ_07280 [Beijerinckiaceae bacterium]
MTKRLGINMSWDLAERVRDLVFYTPGLTVTEFVNSAVAAQLRRAARANGPPPRRTGPLKKGRPLNRGRGREHNAASA